MLSKLNYTNEDYAIQSRLNELFIELLECAKDKVFPYGRTSKDIVLDGIYPNFSHQKCKILYIGRESLGLTGENYIDLMHHAYKVDKRIGTQSLNQHQLHSLKLSIAYGLNQNCCSWQEIPQATEIAKTFASEQGVSYAFMNLSKLSNESDDWAVDWQLVDGFIDAFKNSEINFFSKQIDIIQPDIIITMNLEQRLQVLGQITPLEYGSKASYYLLKTPEREYKLFDLFHFSAIGKSRNECFYTPVVQGIKRFTSNYIETISNDRLGLLPKINCALLSWNDRN